MSQDLARIRENQRRSRARQKEYLKEIEARWQECKLHGVQTSSEIQVAAREVMEENRQLRDLLRKNGIQNNEINAYLRTTTKDTLWMGTQDASTSTTVKALEHKLRTRTACTSPAIVSSQPEYSNLSNEGLESISLQMVSQETSNSNCRAEGHSHNSTSSDTRQPHFISANQLSSKDVHEDRLPNLNNCTIAADMITTMAGGDSNSVKAALGCHPGVDCEVDNQLILGVMDRYTGENSTL